MESVIFIGFMVVGFVLVWRGAGRLVQWTCGLLAPDPRLSIDRAAFMGETAGGVLQGQLSPEANEVMYDPVEGCFVSGAVRIGKKDWLMLHVGPNVDLPADLESKEVRQTVRSSFDQPQDCVERQK